MNGVLMNYINGQRLEVKSETRIPVYNPARGTLLSEIPDTSADQVDQAVQAAKGTRRPICAELHGSVLHAMSWVAFDGEGPPCIGKPPSLPESACRSGPASKSALFPERLMMLALQSAV